MEGYEYANKILLQVKQALLELAQDHQLENSKIQAWRWDEPKITLIWPGNDDISRNIHAHLVKKNAVSWGMEVEVNAWQDVEINIGKNAIEIIGRERHWQHQVIEELDIAELSQRLKDVLETGYARVTSWNSQNLQRTHRLQSLPAE